MPKEYAGNVHGKVGNKAVPSKGGNSPTVPSPGSGNRFAKGEIVGNSTYSGTDGVLQKHK